MKKKYIKFFVTTMILCMSSRVHAKVTSILVKDRLTSNLYEYSYDVLLKDYTQCLMGNVCKLWDEYSYNSKNIIAYKDSKKGYIDFAKIEEDYTQSLLAGESKNYSLDNFTENADSTMIIVPKDKITTRILKNDIVSNGESIVDSEEEFDVKRIY